MLPHRDFQPAAKRATPPPDTQTGSLHFPMPILRQRRGNILVPFGAHLALNLVETLLLWLVG